MLPIDRVGLLDVDWSPDSKYLALTYADGIDLFNLSTHETTTIYDDTAISDAVFSPDGNQLAVSIGYHDGTVKVLEIPSGTVIYRLESFNNGDRVVDLDWNPDGNYIVGIVNKYYGSLAEHWITDLGCSK
jgi:WD40 repeat protein